MNDLCGEADQTTTTGHDMTEKRYTLDEAAHELARRECVEVRHQPSVEMLDYDQEVGAWLCHCNAVMWVAQAGYGDRT